MGGMISASAVLLGTKAFVSELAGFLLGICPLLLATFLRKAC